ncbi:MAG: peptidoglycan-binding protein, partial [Pseudomonadota bacterium]
MTQRGPWSVKGIDDRARLAARDAARVEGLTLGAYLNKLILEEGSEAEDDVPGSASKSAQPAPGSNPNQTGKSAHDIASSALDRLTRRIESTEARSTLAITGIDQSVVGLLARLENAEHTQEAFSIHIDSVLAEVKATYDELAGKVGEIEADDTAATGLAALKSLEDALGQLASHVYEENAMAADETDAIKMRLESGLSEVTERVDGLEAEFGDHVQSAKDELASTVSEAELRVEGTNRHLSERFTSLEMDIAGKLSHIDSVGEIMNGVHAEMTEAVAGIRQETADDLGSINQALQSIQDRLNKAENTTDRALRSLEHTCDSLDRRLADVGKAGPAGASGVMRREFEERFEGLADDLRGIVASARAEMAEEIEAATKLVDQSMIGKLETSVSDLGTRLDTTEELHSQTMDMVSDTVNRVVESVDQRLTANEEQQGKAIDQIGSQVTRISDSLDKRLEVIEDGQSELASQRDEMRRLSETIDERMAQFENMDTSALDAVSEKVESLADKLDERVMASEQRSAEAIEQVGEQVASVAARIDQRQDDAFRAFSEKLEDSQQRQASRLSDALSNVSDRLEQMQQQQITTISPVQKAIATLAQRIEAIEDFATPPFVERTASSELPEMVEPTAFDTTIPDVAADVPMEPPAPATATDLDADTLFESLDLEATAPATPDAEIFGDAGNASPESEPATDGFEAGIESWAAAAIDESGDIDPVADSAFDVSVDLPEQPEATPTPSEPLPEAPEHDYYADLPEPETSWADSGLEARDSDIFDEEPFSIQMDDAEPASILEANIDAFEAAAAAEPQPEEESPEEPASYLSQARAAARAAAKADEEAKKKGWRGKRKEKAAKKDSAKAEKAKAKATKADAKKSKPEKSVEESGKTRGTVPKIAAVSALAIASAGTAGYLYVRGKQPTPSLSLNRITDDAASRRAAADTPASTPVQTAALNTPTNDAPSEAGVTTPDRLSFFSARIEEPLTESPAPTEAAIEPVPELEGAALQTDLPVIPELISTDEAAADGNPIATYQLGLAKLGDGQTADGAELIQTAAADGLAAAQYRLAKLHEQGLGVARDLSEARAWTERAARGGNVKAMHDLAVFMTEGEGGQQSYTGAAEWYRKAAEYGVLDSQFNLAVFYQDGLGVSPSLTESLFWFEVAALQGDADARQSAAALRDRVSTVAAEQVLARAEGWQPAITDDGANGHFPDVPWTTRPTRQHVIAIQTRLVALGYDTGTPDGSMGPRTTDAI